MVPSSSLFSSSLSSSSSSSSSRSPPLPHLAHASTSRSSDPSAARTLTTRETSPPPLAMSPPGAKAASTAVLSDDESLRRRGVPSTTPVHADDHLEALGYKPELARSRSTLQVAFMSFVLASIPYGLATTLSYPIIGGGPVDIIWGWVAVSFVILCVAASLGEITSVYPTAGGKHSSHAPPSWPRGNETGIKTRKGWEN